MEIVDALRAELVSYIRKKFRTRSNITDAADDIVNQAFLDVAKSADFKPCLYNFGYMSTACIRAAYKVFHKNELDGSRLVPFGVAAPLIDMDSFVDEIEKAEDTELILKSLQVLKDVERIIIRERYYDGFSFREISENHGINLNTVLSHHRRALEKLRPVVSSYIRTEDFYE